MRLERVRPCDGECCKESPRWPNADGTNCIYRDADGCTIQAGTALVPIEVSPAQPEKSSQQCFEDTCLNWPANSRPSLGKTGGCCWQWVDD